MAELKKRKPIAYYIAILLTAVAIIVVAIIFKQSFIKVLPCIISLVVTFLSAKANRFTYLIGAINCIIYSVGYYMETIYGSLAQALLIAMPIQIFAFIMWGKRNKDKKDVIIKKLSLKWSIIGLLILVASWVGGYFIFKALKSSYVLLDNTIFVVGLYSSILAMLGFVEAPYLETIKFAFCVALWGVKIGVSISSGGSLANLTYLIYNIYAVIMTTIGTFNWTKIYKINLQNK